MKSLPNILTVGRVLLIPIFVIIYYLPFADAHLVAAILFIVASLTDLLDGYLARRWQVESDLGAFLDPVADKLLVTIALIIVVATQAAWMAIPAAIIIGREIVISAVREWMSRYDLRDKVAVNKMGKYKTAVQMLAVACLILYRPEANLSWALWLGYIALYVAAILTLWSMVVYLQSAWIALKQRDSTLLP